LHRFTRVVTTLFFGLLVSAASLAAPNIQVEALFPGTAVLKIDGKRKMLKQGQAYGGVTLVSAQTDSAIVEVAGKRHTLGLSRHIGSSYAEVEEKTVTLTRDRFDQYQTTITINGRSVLALVDTGATSVAMSESQATALGIDFYGSPQGTVSTASGTAMAYSVMLQSVDVGGIRVDNVRGAVVEGDYPTIVLLGMTYLRHVKMEERDGILTLSRAP
jgi:aspartyl protease family protein